MSFLPTVKPYAAEKTSLGVEFTIHGQCLSRDLEVRHLQSVYAAHAMNYHDSLRAALVSAVTKLVELDLPAEDCKPYDEILNATKV